MRICIPVLRIVHDFARLKMIEDMSLPELFCFDNASTKKLDIFIRQLSMMMEHISVKLWKNRWTFGFRQFVHFLKP